MPETEYKSAVSGDGRGVITKDSKVGHIVGTVVTAAGLAVADALTRLDFSTFPHVVAVLAPVACGLAAGWLTTKLTPRV